MDDLSARRAALGRHVAAARSRIGPGDRSAFARAAGVSRNTATKVEEGGMVRPHVWAPIEEALSWPAGSALAYLDGAGELPGVKRVYKMESNLELHFVAEGAITLEQKMLVLARAMAEISNAKDQSDLGTAPNG